jgi:hypothetical protein
MDGAIMPVPVQVNGAIMPVPVQAAVSACRNVSGRNYEVQVLTCVNVT